MISDLPENIYVSAGSTTNNNKERQITSNDGTKEGGLTIIDGKPYRIAFNTAIETDWNTNKVGGRYTKTEVLRNYLKLKESINALLEAERENQPDSEIENKRKTLNATYNLFTARYGTLNNNVKINFLKDDIDFYSIAAIENVSGHKSDDKGITISRSDIFFKRTLFPHTEPKAESLADAINISKHIKGHLDLNYVSKLMDISLQEARAKILDERLGFINPQTDILEERRMYLSGNVREKLHIAKADNGSGKYNANIEELSKVIPVNIPLVQIKFQLGSTWIPTHIYNVFFKDMFDVDTGFRKTPSDKFFSKIMGKGNSKDMSMGLAAHLKSGSEIAMDCMNNIQTSIYKTEYVEGKSVRVLDKVATAEAQIKQTEINETFENWLKNREEYREELEDIYNDFANAIANTKPDVSKIERFPNAGNEGKILHDHQKTAVLLSLERAVLLAHQVGTGKTLSLITTAMEMKRLGLAQKPMVVIQKATVGQFLAEIKSQYPNARVLAPQGKDLTAAQRQQLFAKIAYNDWDMIVVYHSYFDAIPDDPLRVAAYIEERIFEKQEMLDELESGDTNNGAGFITRALKNDIKSLEAQRKAELQRYERENGVFDESKIIEENNTGQASPAPTITPAKSKGQTIKDEVKGELRRESYFERLLDRRTDRTMNFEDLGVDALLIDEAHSYKKLGFVTSLKNIKGIDTAASQKAQGMKLKSSYILEKHNGRNVVFATGTPISNTMAEMWTFMRYLLSKQQLVDLNINTFDAFVKNFGTVADSSEFSTDGRFKITSRFSSYSNIPELLQVWQSVAHTILSTEVKAVNDRIPKLESDKPIDIMLDKTPPLKEIMKAVIAKLEWFYSLRGKEKKANSHIPLVMYNLAAEAAIDVRLVNSEAEDHPESKTNKAVGYILADLEQTNDYKGTIAVFADRYRNRDGNFNLFKDIKQKLIKAGIPENEIAIINDYNTDSKREELFEKVNAGDVRVVMGTTEKLGTGVNIQQRLHLLVALDAPTRPSDYEQRQGRMMRQGNLHKVWDKSVKILRLGVKQTLDVTGYQRLEIKDRFIKQIMKGDVNGLRTIEEEDEVNASNFNEMMATLSGSDKALKLSLAQNKLRKLTNQKQYHYQNDNFMRQTIKNAKEIIATTDRIIEKFNEYKKQVREFSPHNSVTEITLNGQSAKTPNEMTALLSWVAKAIEERVDVERKRATLKDSKSVVRFEMFINGIRTIITAEIEREFDLDNRKLRMRKFISYTSPDAMVINLYSDTEGSIAPLLQGDTGANIMNLIKNIDRVLSFEDADKAILQQKENYNRAIRDVETFEPQIGLPFAKQNELDTLTNEVKTLKAEAEQEIKELEKQLKEDNTRSADIENYITDAEQDMEAQAIEGAKEYKDLFIAIDKEKFQSLINRLMLTGLAKKVVLDKKAMQEYLRNYFVKQSRLKGKQINDEDIENFLTLWHGTSAYFEKFCKDYFLSGEGAMAYGAGHYFTSRRGIAESYARRHKSASNYIPLSDLQSFTLSDIMFNDYPIKDVLNNTYWESKFLELDGTQYNAIDDFKTAINNLYYDSRYKPKNVRIKEFEKHRKQLLDAIDSGLVTSNKLKNPNNFLLKVKIHGDKTIADLNFLRWDKPITDKQKEVIDNQLNNLQYIRNYQIGEKINVEGLIAQKEEWTGCEIYQMLAALFESDVKTSKFLLSLGIDGIQYPTEYQTKGSHEGNFNYVVFDDNAIEIEGKIRLMQTSKGEIYGFVTKDGTIYLDPDRINANTPIHEFAHLWLKYIKTANPKLYRKGINLISKSRYYQEVLHNSFYANLTEPQKLEEALAFAIGDKGEKVFNEQKDNLTLYAQIKQWLNEFWQWIKRAFNMNGVKNIDNIALENFTDKAVAELLRGKPLNKNRNANKKNQNNNHNALQFQSIFEDFPTAEQREELWNIKQQAIENNTFMKAPNGKDTNLTERQWLQVRTKSFKQWFGDWKNDPENASKVVDENGEPLVVYHGTKSKKIFNVFNNYTDWQERNKAIFFTDNKNIAERQYRVIDDNAPVYEVFLNIKKPRLFNGKGQWHYNVSDRGTAGTKKLSYRSDRLEYNGTIFKNIKDFSAWFDKHKPINVFVAFEPSQIKSATDNTGTFSSDNDDIRFHQSLRSLDKTNKLSAMQGQELDRLLHPNRNSQLYDKIARKLFDQYRPLHTLMLQMQATGHPPKADFYNRAIAATSRATAQIELFNKTLAADFEKAANKIINNPFIKDKNTKPTLDMIDYYFMAKFMPKRTEQLTGIAEEEQGLFGIYLAGENGFAKFLSQQDWYDNTKEADNRDYSPQGYVRWFENNVDKTTLANLQSKKDAIIKYLLDYALEGGQISEIEYTEYLSNKDYMPLRGWQNKTDRMGTDNFFQWLPKKPAGRVSMPDNSIPYLMSIVHSTIIFSEMNRAKRDLGFAIIDNRKNENLSDIVGLIKEYEYYTKNDKGEYIKANPTRTFPNDPDMIAASLEVNYIKENAQNRLLSNPQYENEYKQHLLTFWHNGQKHTIYVENKAITKPFLDNAFEMNYIVTNIAKTTKFFTSMMTSRNLSFVPTNFLRDVQTAFFNHESAKFNKDFLQELTGMGSFIQSLINQKPSEALENKHYGENIKAVIKGVRDIGSLNANDPVEALYLYWAGAGGRTGYVQSFKDIESIAKQLQNKFRHRNIYQKAGKIAKTAVIDQLLLQKYVVAMAEVFENITRFAYFKAALKNGYSMEEAVYKSKDATANFDRKGELSKYISPFIGFYNATMAGIYKNRGQMRGNKWRTALNITSIIAIGFLNAFLNGLLDDDDDKRSAWKKSKNLHFKGINIAPFSYDILPYINIGEQISNIVLNKVTPTEASYNILMGTTEVFPDQAGDILKYAFSYNKGLDKIVFCDFNQLYNVSQSFPTAIVPIIQLATNTNFLGGKIVYEPFSEEQRTNTPRIAYRYNANNTSDLAEWLSHSFNSVFWGSNYNREFGITKSGNKMRNTLNPADVEFLGLSYTSGLWRTTSGFWELAKWFKTDKNMRVSTNDIISKLPIAERFVNPANEVAYSYKQREYFQQKYNPIFEKEKTFKAMTNYKDPDKDKQTSTRKQGKILLNELHQSAEYQEAKQYKDLNTEKKINDKIKELSNASQRGKYNNAEIKKLGREFSDMINNFNRQLENKNND